MGLTKVRNARAQVKEIGILISRTAEETAVQLHFVLYRAADEESAPGQSGEGQQRAEIEPEAAEDIALRRV